MVRTVKIDFDAVSCNPRHMTVSGRGWEKRLIELGASPDEARMLRERLREGVAAQIELARIKALAGVE